MVLVLCLVYNGAPNLYVLAFFCDSIMLQTCLRFTSAPRSFSVVLLLFWPIYFLFCLWLFSPVCSTLHFYLLSIILFSNLLNPFEFWSCPPKCLQIYKYNLFSIPPLNSLVKMLNSTGPGTNPCGILLPVIRNTWVFSNQILMY